MKMHMVVCLFSCVTCPFISFSHCVLIFSNINLNSLSYMLALCWKKSRCKKFEKRRTKLFFCLAVVRLSSLLCVSGDGEGSTSACPVPSLLGSQWPESRLQRPCFSAAFYYEQKNRVTVHYLSSNSVHFLHKVSPTPYVHKHLVHS